nr:hypothetical protein [uncultured Campylobacter sp.]
MVKFYSCLLRRTQAVSECAESLDFGAVAIRGKLFVLPENIGDNATCVGFVSLMKQFFKWSPQQGSIRTCGLWSSKWLRCGRLAS